MMDWDLKNKIIPPRFSQTFCHSNNTKPTVFNSDSDTGEGFAWSTTCWVWYQVPGHLIVWEWATHWQCQTRCPFQVQGQAFSYWRTIFHYLGTMGGKVPLQRVGVTCPGEMAASGWRMEFAGPLFLHFIMFILPPKYVVKSGCLYSSKRAFLEPCALPRPAQRTLIPLILQDGLSMLWLNSGQRDW